MSGIQSIASLNAIGQSIWCDNLSRQLLDSGELKRLVDAGVSGLTSNPTIFNSAISKPDLYDRALSVLVRKSLSTEELAEELMISDVGEAADLLRPVYDQTVGADGYASIEVSPLLAFDTAKTVEEGRRIWSKLDRPNIMIKVPATPQGLPAIEQLLTEGINVNVTLIFSVPVHKAVMQAYINALGKRVASNQAVNNIASVASFFVSRVDAICEKALEATSAKNSIPPEIKDRIVGKVGIANSRLAYKAFQDLFYSENFLKFKEHEAMVQRPLWASTGVKNPNYSPLLYVDQLAGPHTVNTLPPQTLAALLSAGTFSSKISDSVDQAKEIIALLKDVGIDFDALLLELQKQGVDLFADSYRALLKSVEEKALKVK